MICIWEYFLNCKYLSQKSVMKCAGFHDNVTASILLKWEILNRSITWEYLLICRYMYISLTEVCHEMYWIP